MIRLLVQVLVVLGLGSVFAAVLADPRAMLSPGPMLAGHERLAGDCLACHRLGRGVPTAKCTACHAPERIGISTTTGQPIARKAGSVIGSFHARLRERECLACHSDHLGASGDGAGRRFTHAMIEPASRSECASCHRSPPDALHRGAANACAKCHSTERWTPATFEHAKYFVLDRDHNAACATCHPGSVFERYTCYGCHEHSEARIRGKHVEEGIRDFTDCVRCHRSAAEREGGGREGGRGRGGHEGGRGRGEHEGGEGD